MSAYAILPERLAGSIRLTRTSANGYNAADQRGHMPEFVVDFSNTGPPPEADGRLDAAAFHRNHAPIWSVIAPFLDARTGDALEVGSGTGQHAVAFARQAPGVTWWPSDLNANHLA